MNSWIHSPLISAQTFGGEFSRIGRLLCQQAERRLVEQGLNEVTLWVLKGNRLAQHFYNSTGFIADPYCDKTIGRGRLQEIRMRKRLA